MFVHSMFMVCSTVTSNQVFHHVEFEQNCGFAPLPSSLQGLQVSHLSQFSAF